MERAETEDVPMEVPETTPLEDSGGVKDAKTTQMQPLTYQLEDRCPFDVAILYGVQTLLEQAPGQLGVAYMVHEAICGGDDKLLLAQLVSSYIFLSGLGSLLQMTLGVRIPMLEGSSFSYLGPVVAMMSTGPFHPCPASCSTIDFNGSTSLNATVTDALVNATSELCEDRPWNKPLLQISGSLLCAAAVQMVLGMTGLVGFLLNYISSLTIAVTVSLLGISVAPFVAQSAGTQWSIALFTFGLFFLFALVLAPYSVPVPSFSREKGLHFNRIYLFRLFPALFSLGISWSFYYILEKVGVISEKQDTSAGIVYEASWIFIPYPGRYGMPTFGTGIFVAFLGSVIVSTMESVGDYYALSRAVQVSSPPKHAVNRGIVVEGFITLLFGACGASLGATSYSSVAGLISVTGMGSRSAWLVVSGVVMAVGVTGKLGALLTMVPVAIVGGLNIIGVGLIAAVGLSFFQFVDLKSVRNILIIAGTLMLGLIVPYYLQANPGTISTGNHAFDQVLTIVLSTSMLVGGAAAFFLDNILPGTKEERGLLTQSTLLHGDQTIGPKDERTPYDLPFHWFRDLACCRYMPFLPAYDDSALLIPKKKCFWRHKNSREDDDSS